MSKNPPVASVIMSVYNGEEYLDQAVKSILAQTFTDFEFIIINDASSDNTSAILDKYHDNRIIRVNNEKNIGLTSSLNKGIAIALGEFIARQDADDISHPERLDVQCKYLENNPSVGLIGSCPWIIDFNGQQIKKLRLPLAPNFEDPNLVRNPFCHGSIIVRRSVLAKAGGYREFFQVSQDHDLWRRLSEFCQLKNIENSLYYLRNHVESISHNRFLEHAAARQVIIELANQRRVYGVDDFGLKYQEKWDEALVKKKWRKMESYNAYIRAYCNFRRGNLIPLNLWLICSLFLFPKNRLSLILKQNQIQKIKKRLSFTR